jgi:hypothetical protein
MAQHGLPPSALREVECRRSLCRITLSTGTLARDDLEVLWGKEPLLHGSFDFASEDGTERVVYAGLAESPLQFPAPDEAAP